MPLRFASKTDRESVSTDESVQVTHSAPALSRKEASEESTSNSKFIEAMKNPNWRRRREGSSAISSTDTELNCDSPKSLVKRGESESTDISGYSTVHRYPSQLRQWDYIAQHVKSETQESRNSGRDNRPSPTGSIEEDILVHPLRRGIYEVIKHVDLPGIKSEGKSLSIFELAPYPVMEGRSSLKLEFNQTNLNDGFVEIQWIGQEDEAPFSSRNKSPHVSSKRSNESHDKIPPHSSVWDLEQDHGYQPPTKRRIQEARNAVLHDPAITDVGTSYLAPQLTRNTSLERSAFGHSTGKSTRKDSPKNSAFLQKRNFAFQKMLNKLNSGTSRGEKAKSPQKVSGQSNVRHASNAYHQPAARDAGPWRLRNSDSGFGSFTSSHESHSKETSRDSAISLNSALGPSGLNPKAREFLSLGDTDCGTPEQGFNLRPRRQTGSDQSYQQNSQDDTIPIKHLTGLAQTPGPEPLGYMVPPGLSSPRGLTMPFAFATKQAPPVFITPPGLGMLPIDPRNSAYPGYPFPIAMAPPPMPAQYPPLSSPGFIHPPPMPVPKPRKPDAMNQQAYEAYLEWRKANEPGYALECRQRQQRRAQRQIPHKGNSQPATKSPAVVGAS